MSHELTTVPASTLEDVDLVAFREWLDENIPGLSSRGSLEDALQKLRLAAPMGSRVIPTIALIYAFGDNPQWLQPQLTLSFSAYAGGSVTSELLLTKHLSGRMHVLLEEAMAAIEDNARPVVDQVRPDNSDLEFPRRAVREALSNALIHRDLKSAAQIQVRMFVDRLEIWSPGAMVSVPEPGVSIPRNPLLARIARSLGMVEQLGRGISTIESECTREGLQLTGAKDGVTLTLKSMLFGLTPSTLETN